MQRTFFLHLGSWIQERVIFKEARSGKPSAHNLSTLPWRSAKKLSETTELILGWRSVERLVNAGSLNRLLRCGFTWQTGSLTVSEIPVQNGRGASNLPRGFLPETWLVPGSKRLRN
jgi:hypothetical protein